MNYREIDLNLLLILDALYDTGSTTLVAERLKVSQPTVSFSLGKLRDVFGDELFVRHGASMQPTPLAQSIREPVRRVDRNRAFRYPSRAGLRSCQRRANFLAQRLRHRRTGIPAAAAGATHGQRAEAEPAVADHAAGRVREAMTTGGVDLARLFPRSDRRRLLSAKAVRACLYLPRPRRSPHDRRPDQHEAIPRRRSCRGHAGRPQPGDRRAADGRDGTGAPYRAAVAAFHERAASGGDLQYHFDRAARGRTGLHAHRPAQAAGAAVQDSEHRTQAILAPPCPYRPGRALVEKSDRQALSEP